MTARSASPQATPRWSAASAPARCGSQATSGVGRFYLEGGFVEVLGDVVSVLTPRAIPAEELDPVVAQEQLLSVRTRPAHNPEQVAARQRVSDQYRAQLRVAREPSSRVDRRLPDRAGWHGHIFVATIRGASPAHEDVGMAPGTLPCVATDNRRYGVRRVTAISTPAA